ncbi:MAG: 2-isopropylmalate synthase [Candidatus Brocadiaceae bacterium]|nr:2-isopropylmalate synthase [Candidatus Brocadiaceae bacterium]
MLKFDERTQTLLREEHLFELQEPIHPEYYDDLFPDGAVPKIIFNHRHVPMRPAAETWITDTTFRDGQQAMAPMTTRQIVDLYKMLHRLGGEHGLIRTSEFFVYEEHHRHAVEECLSLGYEYPQVTSWIRAHPKDFQLVKDMGLEETGMLTSVSDYHIFHKWPGSNRRQAIDRYLAVVKEALSAGIRLRCHFEDITRADFYGFVVPFAIELRKLAEESGIPIRIRACDTMGYGVTYPGASLPRSVPGIIYGLNYHAGIPSEWLEWHGHNDFHRALINCTTAWLYGCSAANGTLLGIGERTGNPPIEALVIEHLALRGDDPTVDTRVITEIARYFRQEIGYSIPPQQPLVGARFNTTLAGIHADALSKDKRIYTIFDTEQVLGVPPDIRITDKCGRAGIVYWVNLHLALEGDRAVGKDHPGVQAILDNVTEQYARGRVTVMSEEEMFGLVAQHMPELADRIDAVRA